MRNEIYILQKYENGETVYGLETCTPFAPKTFHFFVSLFLRKHNTEVQRITKACAKLRLQAIISW